MLSNPQQFTATDGKNYSYYDKEVREIKQKLQDLQQRNLNHYNNKLSTLGFSLIYDMAKSTEEPLNMNQIRLYFILTTFNGNKIYMFIEGLVQPTLNDIVYSFYVDSNHSYFEDTSFDKVESVFQSHLDFLISTLS